MSTSPSIAYLALLVATTATLAQPERRDDPPKANRLVLTGYVERVYSSETQLPNGETDTRYAIEVKLTISKGDGYPAGRTIFFKMRRVGQHSGVVLGSPAQPSPPVQPDIPAHGDIIEVEFTGEPGAVESRPPNAIRIVTPGSYKSELTSLAMTLIQPGEFLMGSPGTEAINQSQHRVKFTKPYYIGTHEVTQFEYRLVMQSKPSSFAINGLNRDKVPKMITDRFPVENVSWFDAAEFCNRLSQKDGFEPYYKITDVKKEAETIVAATVSISGGTGYRLPTEAEWEYACRAGTTTQFHYGTESTAGTANIPAPLVPSGYGSAPKWKSPGRTVKVGSYDANEWGLFDMHGNVAEWCGDWYDKDYYLGSPAEDPQGPQTGTYKVLRGGSWLMPETSARSHARFFHLPSEAKYYGGFRVARSP